MEYVNFHTIYFALKISAKIDIPVLRPKTHIEGSRLKMHIYYVLRKKNQAILRNLFQFIHSMKISYRYRRNDTRLRSLIEFMNLLKKHITCEFDNVYELSFNDFKTNMKEFLADFNLIQ